MNPSLLQRTLYRVLVIIGVIVMCGEASAQTPSLDEGTSGTRYLIAFPDTTSNSIDPRFPDKRVQPEFSIWIYSQVTNKVRITTGDGATTMLDVPGGSFRTHSFNPATMVTTINSVSRNTCKVESEFPIMLYCYMRTSQSMEAWTPIPIDRWGMRYHAAAVPGEVVRDVKEVTATGVSSVKKTASAEILVIAAFDNTRVTITPPFGTLFVGFPPRVIILNEGEVYQVQSLGDTAVTDYGWDDIAGAHITADRPVGVLSGNTRAQIDMSEGGILNNIYKNMLMEWLAPDEQHGTEFVYMPTWDARRPGSGSSAERKRELAQIYSTQEKVTKGYYLQPGANAQVPFTVDIDTAGDFLFGAPQAVLFKTEIPSQGMMYSTGVVKFNDSTPCGGGTPCASYDGWAPYMVEMIPREQWSTFAPFHVPASQSGMEHFVNVVTDTLSMQNIYRENGSRFLFTRKIPGTDLIWGSIAVAPGTSNYLVGMNGAKFNAVAYGLLKGHEEFRPGEYEEYSALSYGYPLAPMRNVLRSADSLRIDTTMRCGKLTIRAEAINQNPSGFRSVTLDPSTVVNARLVLVDPSNLSDIVGRFSIDAIVEPLDRLRNASAVVILKDRTGKTWKIYYSYEAEYVVVDPTAIDFGLLPPGSGSTKIVTVTNPTSKALRVKEIRLANGAAGYTISATTPDGPARTPAVPVELAPGASMSVTVDFAAGPPESGVRRDTVRVILDCFSVQVPLVAQSGASIIHVDDINFGSFRVGDAPRTMNLRICNNGQGPLTFDNPNDPNPRSLLEWIDASFTVADPAQIEALKTMTLNPGQCYVEIRVTFTPSVPGTFRTVARVWGSTRNLRDTSVWTANVTGPSGVDDAVAGGYALAVAGDGAKGDAMDVRYSLGAPSHVRLEVFDALGRSVALLLNERSDAGAHVARWEIAGRSSGIYYCRMVAGEWSRTIPIVVAR